MKLLKSFVLVLVLGIYVQASASKLNKRSPKGYGSHLHAPKTNRLADHNQLPKHGHRHRSLDEDWMHDFLYHDDVDWLLGDDILDDLNGKNDKAAQHHANKGAHFDAPKTHRLTDHIKIPKNDHRDISPEEEEMIHEFLFHNDVERHFDDDILDDLSMEMFGVPLEVIKGAKRGHKRHVDDHTEVHQAAQHHKDTKHGHTKKTAQHHADNVAHIDAPKAHRLTDHSKIPKQSHRDISLTEEEFIHAFLFHDDAETLFDEDILNDLSMEMFGFPLEMLKGAKDIHRRHVADDTEGHQIAHRHKAKTSNKAKTARQKEKTVAQTHPVVRAPHAIKAGSEPLSTNSKDAVNIEERQMDSGIQGISYLIIGIATFGITLCLVRLVFGRKRGHGELPFVMPKNYQNMTQEKPRPRRQSVKQAFFRDTVVDFNY